MSGAAVPWISINAVAHAARFPVRQDSRSVNVGNIHGGGQPRVPRFLGPFAGRFSASPVTAIPRMRVAPAALKHTWIHLLRNVFPFTIDCVVDFQVSQIRQFTIRMLEP